MNDPASLQNLNPIVLPPEAGLWPPAPGWYLVLLLILLVILKAIFTWYGIRRANRYRSEALRQLSQVQQRVEAGDSSALRELPVLVKGTALHAFPRKEIAGLFGEKWLDFLDRTTASNTFRSGSGRLLPALSYERQEKIAALTAEEIRSCLDAVRFWIRNHKAVEMRGDRHD